MSAIRNLLDGRCVMHVGDCLKVMRGMPSNFVDCVVTSPPYWGLRDYGVTGQIGLEPTLGEHLEKLVEVFREIWRILKQHGTVSLVAEQLGLRSIMIELNPEYAEIAQQRIERAAV